MCIYLLAMTYETSPLPPTLHDSQHFDITDIKHLKEENNSQVTQNFHKTIVSQCKIWYKLKILVTSFNPISRLYKPITGTVLNHVTRKETGHVTPYFLPQTQSLLFLSTFSCIHCRRLTCDIVWLSNVMWHHLTVPGHVTVLWHSMTVPESMKKTVWQPW